MPNQNPRPMHPDLAVLVLRLVELRNALIETGLALSDFQFSIDTAERRAAEHEVLQVIDRAKSHNYSLGDGQDTD